MKLSVLPEKNATAFTLGSSANAAKQAMNSSFTAREMTLTGWLLRSSTTVAMPSATSHVRAGAVRAAGGGQSVPSAALQHHRECHPAHRAHRDQAELHVTPPHLVGERGDQPPAGRAERVADRDRATHDVDDVLVDLPALGREPLKIREHLRREGFVNLDQTEVLPLDAGALECLGDGPNRRLEQLPPRVHGGDRVGADVAER